MTQYMTTGHRRISCIQVAAGKTKGASSTFTWFSFLRPRSIRFEIVWLSIKLRNRFNWESSRFLRIQAKRSNGHLFAVFFRMGQNKWVRCWYQNGF